jgi:hypothetical protein
VEDGRSVSIVLNGITSSATVQSSETGSAWLVNSSVTVSSLADITGAGGNDMQLARVDGGGGFDTIQLSGGASIDLSVVANQGGAGPDGLWRINSIEVIDLMTDSAANTLTLVAQDVVDLAGMNLIHTTTPSANGNTWTSDNGKIAGTTPMHQLLVNAGAGDVVNLNGGGTWVTAVNAAGEVHSLA